MATTDDAPSYSVRAHTAARTELDGVPAEVREQLTERIQAAARRRQPSTHPDATVLRDADLFRIRAGRYRALCTLAKPDLRVLLVAERDEVYDRIPEAERRAGL